MSHTPGPWKVNWLYAKPLDSQDDELAPHHDTTERKYSIVGTICSATADAEVIARLIAAAPELLEALKEAESVVVTAAILSYDEDFEAYLRSRCLPIVRAAIAKAEGRTE